MRTASPPPSRGGDRDFFGFTALVSHRPGSIRHHHDEARCGNVTDGNVTDGRSRMGGTAIRAASRPSARRRLPMLGSLAEADDAVQEAWLRLSRSDASVVK